MAEERPAPDIDGPDVDAGSGASPEADDDQPSPPLRSAFGTAVGAAMMGFEQAIRSEPPAEIMAAEHAPELGQSGENDGIVIVIPDPLPPRR